jgi:hypothetical protein
MGGVSGLMGTRTHGTCLGADAVSFFHLPLLPKLSIPQCSYNSGSFLSQWSEASICHKISNRPDSLQKKKPKEGTKLHPCEERPLKKPAGEFLWRKALEKEKSLKDCRLFLTEEVFLSHP